MSTYKVTDTELKGVADSIREINQENGIYKWPTDYISKISQTSSGIATLENKIKEIIADRDEELHDEIMEKDLKFPEEVQEALYGDGIDLDGDGEADTNSILKLLTVLEDSIKDIKIIEVTSYISGSDNIFRYINQIEKHCPVVGKERFSIYVLKNIYKHNNAILCIPTMYDEIEKIRKATWGFFFFSEETTGYKFFSMGNPSSDSTVIPAGNTLIRVAIYDETI